MFGFLIGYVCMMQSPGRFRHGAVGRLTFGAKLANDLGCCMPRLQGSSHTLTNLDKAAPRAKEEDAETSTSWGATHLCWARWNAGPRSAPIHEII